MTMSNNLVLPLEQYRAFIADPTLGQALARETRLQRQRQRESERGAQTEAFTNLKLEEQLRDRAGDATRDTFTWVTQYAKTYNEHWIEEGRPDPYEHFPSYEY